MSGQWTTLQAVLQPAETSIEILEHVFYKCLTVRPYPKGVVLIALKSGLEFPQKRQNLIRAGQFVVARHYAPRSSFGIVPPQLDGGVVTLNYLTYDLHPDLYPDYFAAYLSTPNFRRMSLDWYNENGRLQPAKFATTPIFFPLAEDQHQIAELWQHTNEALELTVEMLTSMSQIKVAIAMQLFQSTSHSWEAKKLGDCTQIERNLVGENVVTVVPPHRIMLGAQASTAGSMGLLANVELDPQFLYYYLESQMDALSVAIRASKRSLQETLRELPLRLPTLYQQRKIAAVLQQHDDALLLLRQEQTALRRFTQGIMHLIFSGSEDLQGVLTTLRNFRL
ncbi:MAG: restriction endonuclease subunit S [Chloroflexota bacterium]